VANPAASAARFRARGGLSVLTWPALESLGVDAVVTTRYGGVSRGPYRSLNLGLHVGDDPSSVLENRRRAARAVDAHLDDLIIARQVHGRSVALVTAADRGRGARRGEDAPAEADVLVTTAPGPGLVTLVADCVPLVLYAPGPRALACVHAGWRGTMEGVAGSALETLTALGSRPSEVHAAIGPAVAPERYEVGAEVARAARRAFTGDVSDIVWPGGGGRWQCDLVAANRRALTDAGVRPERVLVASATTGPGGPFFSDRASRPCGRFALLARLRA
jgi:purine-nucleoside/S-methyl-5'-thioadenosine phosphorylase / adenosine deaminase